ncbi:hypothetical protein F511_10955 [Dorcoceras hygrometricum]|uniref:Uncharacterized protein n=1 Tax=Dorcoceras hygrometricum TaxID=472368 RepID=A0A2Z7A8B1_9LAMI|nr:hypothetical protein F511_10955 [Dorcoceras hygrometricum]
MFAQPMSKAQQSTAQQFARAVASDRPSMRGTSKQRPAISRESGGQLSVVAQRYARPPCGQRPAFDRLPVRNVLRKTAGHRAPTRRDITRPRTHNCAREWPPRTATAGGQVQIFFCFNRFKIRDSVQYGSIVLKNPSHSSDTTVGNRGGYVRDSVQYGSIVLKNPSHSSDTTVGNRGGYGSRLLAAQRKFKIWLRETSTTGRENPSSACTRRSDEISTDGFSLKSWPEQLRKSHSLKSSSSAQHIELSFPGFSAGRGDGPAGGAPGDG